jgi:hypothetical protein
LERVGPYDFAVGRDRLAGAVRLDKLTEQPLLLDVPPPDAEERALIVGRDPV